MLRKILLTLSAAAVAATMIVSVPGPAHAQGKGGKGKGGAKGKGKGAPQGQQIQQLRPNFYIVTGAGGNTTVRVTDEGLIVVDTKNRGDDNYNDLMEQIRTVSNAPVRYVFITHHHQDHSGNIGNFKAAGAEVIGHEGLQTNLRTYEPPAGKPADPSATYSDVRRVTLGGVNVEAHHWASAHTGGDSIIYFPEDGVVASGDNVVGFAPNIDFPFGGSAVGWLDQLEEIANLNFTLLIPGHGDPMTKADFMNFKRKFDTLIDRGAELAQSGTPKDQILAAIRTDDIGWNVNTGQWSNPERLDPFYEELRNK